MVLCPTVVSALAFSEPGIHLRGCSGMGWDGECGAPGAGEWAHHRCSRGLCQSSPSLDALEGWSIFPRPSQVHLKGSCSEHSRWLWGANQDTGSGDSQGISLQRALSPKPQQHHRQIHTHRAFLGKQEPREQVHGQCGVSTNSSQSSALYELPTPSEIQVPAPVASSEWHQLSRARNSQRNRRCLCQKLSCQKLLSDRPPDPACAGGDVHTIVVDFRALQHTETPLSYPWEPSFHSPSPPPHPKATLLLPACC